MPDVRMAELESADEYRDAFPVMMQLWGDVDREFTEQSFIELLQELKQVEGYRLFGLFADETLVAVAGASIRMSAWYGRYLWVYDLVTDSAHRSKGYGEEMLRFLKEWARDRGCETIALAAELGNTQSHRFYEALDMEKSSYVFKQKLD